uniref:Adipogenesis regulatory factor n=1 Tax=Ovis aries TaxID=9940 RepID=A0AC11CYD0_SHEEP
MHLAPGLGKVGPLLFSRSLKARAPVCLPSRGDTSELLEILFSTVTSAGTAVQQVVDQATEAGQKAMDQVAKTTQETMDKTANQASEAFSGFGKKFGLLK